jgi:hypothetical protein
MDRRVDLRMKPGPGPGPGTPGDVSTARAQ